METVRHAYVICNTTSQTLRWCFLWCNPSHINLPPVSHWHTERRWFYTESCPCTKFVWMGSWDLPPPVKRWRCVLARKASSTADNCARDNRKGVRSVNNTVPNISVWVRLWLTPAQRRINTSQKKGREAIGWQWVANEMAPFISVSNHIHRFFRVLLSPFFTLSMHLSSSAFCSFHMTVQGSDWESVGIHALCHSHTIVLQIFILFPLLFHFIVCVLVSFHF